MHSHAIRSTAAITQLHACYPCSTRAQVMALTALHASQSIALTFRRAQDLDKRRLEGSPASSRGRPSLLESPSSPSSSSVDSEPTGTPLTLVFDTPPTTSWCGHFRDVPAPPTPSSPGPLHAMLSDRETPLHLPGVARNQMPAGMADRASTQVREPRAPDFCCECARTRRQAVAGWMRG